MKKIVINFAFNNLAEQSKVLHVEFCEKVHLQEKLTALFNFPPESYYLIQGGKLLNTSFENDKVVYVVPRICGGKGGFGSMLRAIGAQIEKTTNREACRDLSGRRLRDINEEQRLKKWISQQAERERENEERRRKKLEKLTSEPKHEFKDESYDQERSELSERLCDSVEQGLKAGSSGIKRKSEDLEPVKKKKKLLLDLDEDSDSEGGSDVDETSNSSVSLLN